MFFEILVSKAITLVFIPLAPPKKPTDKLTNKNKNLSEIKKTGKQL